MAKAGKIMCAYEYNGIICFELLNSVKESVSLSDWGTLKSPSSLDWLDCVSFSQYEREEGRRAASAAQGDHGRQRRRRQVCTHTSVYVRRGKSSLELERLRATGYA